ncbi:PREDICTED: polynucleotide 5'-hydroxyl-kinase NOL9-like [Polistes dominula]|uniref:Polynucleotide 5'-hydroxyl-kinase NOL9 n=1 Tax=Polistes dominula TaxID=743375 RepID=A0ABM1IX75_POLDO|nr:PREDICTED: polynucleotide 5'-hydroxyl-kinase NOL9-like [Polistes dominula]
MNRDKHNSEKSHKGKFSRRRSLSECAASSSSTTSDQSYNKFNIKTKKDLKILSKNDDSMEKDNVNVFSKWNHCELLNSTIDSSVKTKKKIFGTNMNLGSSEIIRSVSELNLSDSLEENKNVSKEQIFDYLKSINFDEMSTTQSGNRKNWRKSKNTNERSQFRYNISKKKTTVDATQYNNEVQECETQDAMMHNVNKSCTKSKRPITTNTNTTMSNYNKKIRLYCLNNKVLIIMEENTSFCFNGKLSISVLYGAIEVYGSHVTRVDSPISVYSPKGYSCVVIENSHKYACNNIDIWTSLSKEGINPDIKNALQYDINHRKPGMAVITLINLENKLTTFVDAYFSMKLFPTIRNVRYYSWIDRRRAEMILQSNLYFDIQNYKRLVIDPTITGILAEKMINRWHSNNWSCTLIAGGKSVGKSTTVRYLINTLLSITGMVALVDVDLGQSECTPPGNVSYSLIKEPLAGPNFTHLLTPVYQLYIGDVNVTRCITRYIECLKLLASNLLLCPTLSRLPIVINTMGFTEGIGWDLVVFTIKLFQPSFIVQIMSEKTKNNYANLLSSDIINSQTLAGFSWSENIEVNINKPCSHELYVINTNAEMKRKSMNETLDMEPYQQRELAMMSYLSEIINPEDNFMFCAQSASLNINETEPFVIPFASITIVLLQKDVPPSNALKVINGSLVALCGVNWTGVVFPETVPPKPRILTTVPLCICYGYGIIRGVDTEKEEIYIISPLPFVFRQRVNCLIGSITMPMNLLRLNQPNVSHASGNNTLPTSRDPRKEHFRMRRKNRRTSD